MSLDLEGQRYHLQEWRRAGNAPSTTFFNMKDSFALNFIERAFDMFKNQWKLLREKSYYLVEVQTRTTLAYCLLYSLIHREMTNADISEDVDEGDSTYATTAGNDIHYIETLNEWNQIEGRASRRNVQ
ncbi:putative nuclease HARBI1 [Cucumis melo var. makuwa]|uniref:Nuclease HARBI1 n=1 Tax=Cucumis melo var. makuwa TaxID=1194695 RepID=A0A5A7U881_CUCMM|nr:putative nuclease HARBI1 [Cucumis melo var. makuwa]